MKRSRGRGRRQQNPVNRSYDSNGPDVRVRGTASQVYEKYQALSRDAMASGDRVMAENYGQHAEHYYRIMLSFQPAPGEADKENDKDMSNGQAGAGRTEGNGVGDGGSSSASASSNDGSSDGASEPLVLVRENGAEGDATSGDEPSKPSRRRGPLRKKKASGAGAETPPQDGGEESFSGDAEPVSDAPVTPSE
jgi:hypothetical protein